VFRCITAIALANIEWFAVQGVLVVYATRELGLSPALLGISLAAIGPLSLLGAGLAGPLTARWGLGPVMIAALFLETLSRLLLPFASGTPVQAATVLGLSQALLGLTVPVGRELRQPGPSVDSGAPARSRELRDAVRGVRGRAA